METNLGYSWGADRPKITINGKEVDHKSSLYWESISFLLSKFKAEKSIIEVALSELHYIYDFSKIIKLKLKVMIIEDYIIQLELYIHWKTMSKNA